MNIGNLYTVKKWFWLLFPTKEIAAAYTEATSERSSASYHQPAASYWSKRFNREVVCFPPDSIVVFLEEDGKLKKVLTSDGLVGWTWFTENYNDCFEILETSKWLNLFMQ
jgi:hypothetical protein